MDQTNNVMLESQILMTTQTPNSTLTLCRCDIHCAFVSREWSNGGVRPTSPVPLPRVPYFYCAQREGWSEEGREGWACPPLPPSPSLSPDRNRNVAATATKSILVVNSRVTPKGRRRRRRRLGRRRRRNRSLQLMTERLRRQLRGGEAANDEEEPF